MSFLFFNKKTSVFGNSRFAQNKRGRGRDFLPRKDGIWETPPRPPLPSLARSYADVITKFSRLDSLESPALHTFKMLKLKYQETKQNRLIFERNPHYYVLDLDLRNMASGRVILYRLKPWIFYKVFKYNRPSLDQPTLFDFVWHLKRMWTMRKKNMSKKNSPLGWTRNILTCLGDSQ